MKNNLIDLLEKIKIAYPYHFRNMSVSEAQKTIKLWEDMLGDFTDEERAAAIERLIISSPYPPSISELITECGKAKAFLYALESLRAYAKGESEDAEEVDKLIINAHLPFKAILLYNHYTQKRISKENIQKEDIIYIDKAINMMWKDYRRGEEN